MYTINYYDRQSQTIKYKEYKSKKAFIKRLRKVLTGDTLMITIDGNEVYDYNTHLAYELERS